MCAKCTEIDFKIAHYRQMATRITDPLTLDGIAGLMKELANAKTAPRGKEIKFSFSYQHPRPAVDRQGFDPNEWDDLPSRSRFACMRL